jgi:hypothetical protein
MEQAIYWLTGVVGVPMIQWLKTQFGWQGTMAVWLTNAVAVILALVALLFSEQLNWQDFSAGNFIAVFGQVLAVATIAYKLLLKE